MLKLTVVSGPQNASPTRGTSFSVENGEVSIGRHSQNQIVLQSGNVSKKHCVLVVDNSSIFVRDNGSANGTFVNGQLAAQKLVKSGDRISVGDFVLEVSDPAAKRAQKTTSSFPVSRPNNVLSFPGTPHAGNTSGFSGFPGQQTFSAPSSSVPAEAPMPRDLLGRVRYLLEKTVMPYFYGFNEKYEWRMVFTTLVGIFVIANLFISLSPLLASHKRTLAQEQMKRALVMARELADRNTPALAANQETKTALGFVEHAEAVRYALVVDLSNRIITPATKAGRYFELGTEATYTANAKTLYTQGRETGIVGLSDTDTIVAVEPIRIYNPQVGKNEIRHLAVVVMDATLASAGMGEMSMVYATTFVLTALLAFVVFYILYRVTLKPLETMNSKIDQALRGDGVEMKSPVYWEEIDPLWNVIDAALKRVPRDSMDGSGGGAAILGGALSAQDLAGPLRSIAIHSKEGVAILDEDRKVLFINSQFEEITGTRLEGNEGQVLTNVVREQAFGSFLTDLFDRAHPGSEGVGEDFEFSGTQFKVHCVSFGTMGTSKCFVVTVSKPQEG